MEIDSVWENIHISDLARIIRTPSPVAHFLSDDLTDEDIYDVYWNEERRFLGKTFPLHQANPQKHQEVLRALRVDHSTLGDIEVVYRDGDESSTQSDDSEIESSEYEDF